MSQNHKSAEEIASLAYRIWEQEGRPAGKDQEHWFRAEAALKDAVRKNSPSSGLTDQNGMNRANRPARAKK